MTNINLIQWIAYRIPHLIRYSDKIPTVVNIGRSEGLQASSIFKCFGCRDVFVIRASSFLNE
jgi:hypothetical protein